MSAARSEEATHGCGVCGVYVLAVAAVKVLEKGNEHVLVPTFGAQIAVRGRNHKTES